MAAGSLERGKGSGFDLIADLIGTIEGGPVDMSARQNECLKAKGYGKPEFR